MNRCYRLVFNHSVQAWQAVAELAKARGKSHCGSQGGSQGKTNSTIILPKLKKLAICTALGHVFVTPSIVHALPLGADVQFGQASFQTNGNNLTINQGSKQLIAHWQSFGIGANESVHLLQPNQGVALFRVVGSESSQIYGSLSATGSLFLVNPNGVFFGQGSQVDVGSLVATSMNISNTDFLGGRYQFNADGNNGNVVNQGVIKAADGGYIVLLGNVVKNNGTLTANNGSVVLGSAQSAMLDFYGNGLVKAKLSGDALNALVEQTGSIQADGGAVQLATNSRSSAVNVSGLVQANSLVKRNGLIRLEGGNNAKVSVSGTLSANGNQAGTKAGKIEVTGEQVALFKDAKLDASGHSGGGEVLVGGDYQGKNSQILNARTTYIDKDATISADAKEIGDGGKVIVWADEVTRYYGSISAKGGKNSGNGGFAEVSGKRLLNFLGKVDLSASQGVGGNLLLDPTNITLSTGVDTNTAGFTPPGDITEAFADDAGLNSIFNVNAGGSFAGIAAGSTITLQATNNITVSNTFNVATATGSANNSLVLQANNNINVNAAVTTTGTGAITMNANADNVGGGNLAIASNISSQAGGITLTGANIIRTAGNIASTGAAGSNAGNINIAGTGTVNLGAATVAANGGTASAGTTGRNGGDITISGAGVTATGAIAANGSNGNGANQIGGNAGSVSITSSNGISAGAITSSGGNAGTGIAAGGNAGTITLTNNSAGNIVAGALTARTGNAIGTGAGGATGAINVTNNASGTLTTGALNSAGGSNGNGGAINVTTASGNIITTTIASSGGTAITGTAGRNAGAININSGGSVTTTTIAANGSAGVGANQNGGNAANVTISANGGVSTAAIGASGGAATATNANGGNGANVSITNNGSGNITTTTMTARNGNATGAGTGGTAGSISAINNAVAGNISTTTLSTAGSTFGHGGNITLNAMGDVSVNSTISSAGGTTLTGNAGRNAGTVNINAGGNIVTGAIAANASAGVGTNQNGGNGGDVMLDAGAGNTITHANITSSGGARTGTGVSGNGGNINIADNALLSANASITATAAAGGGTGGNITWGGSVNSLTTNRSLVVNTNGVGTFNGTVGDTLALTSLTTNAAGTTQINGGSVTTDNAQTYNDAVTLGTATDLNTTNSNILFANRINASGNTLTMSTGAGNITATNASNNFANVAIASANNVSLRDANAIQLGTTDITGTFGLQTAGAITQTAGITVGGTTTINAGAANNITLNNSANNFNTVTITSGRDVSLVDSNTMFLNTSSVRTITAQTLSDNLTLLGNITATGTGSGTSINLAAAQNFLNPSNRTLTPGVGSRWLVYSTDPTNDTRGAGLITSSNFKQYNTTFPGTVSGTGNGFVYSISPIIAATLSGTASKVYDGTTTASIASLTLDQTGAIDGDTVTLGGSLTSATYDDRNVGIGKTLTSNNGLTITGATNGGKQVFGYQLAADTASGNVGTITQANLTISTNNVVKTYDATTTAAGTATVASGALFGADSISGGTFAYSNVNAGTNKTVTTSGVTVADGNSGGNYNVTFADNTTSTINKASLNLNAATDTKAYDGTTASAGVVATVGLFGADNVTGLSQSFTSKNVLGANGSTLNVDTGFTVNDGNGGNNYTVAQNSATGSINKADITAVAGITANDKIYDATTTATLNTGAASFTGIVGGETLTVGAANGVFNSKDVLAANTVNIGGITLGDGTGSASNYNLTNNTASAAANITARPITINANDGQTKSFGSADPLPFSFNVSGLNLVGGDTLSGALNRANGETVGNYAINQGTLDAGSNYIINYIGNTFAIVAPATSVGGSSPRDAAGLGSLLTINYRSTQSLTILNVAAPGAGALDDVENSAESCEVSKDPKLNNPNTSIIFNFGIKLPKGVKPVCI